MLRNPSFRIQLRPSLAGRYTVQLNQRLLMSSSLYSVLSTDASTSGSVASDSSSNDAEPSLGQTGFKESFWRQTNVVRKVWRVETPAELKPKTVAPPAELLGLPHIAVMGRSNSGKSSCLNRLFGKGSQNRAKSSSRHGKTTGIEVFTVNDRVALADLPGHTIFDGGRLNKDWVLTWGPLVKTFLKTFAPPRDTASAAVGAEGASSSLNDLDLEAPWSDRTLATASAEKIAETAEAAEGAAAAEVSQSGLLQQRPPLLPSLHGVLFLCDIRWPVAPEDRELLRLCKDDLNLPVLLVFTKDDLIGKKAHADQKMGARKRYELKLSQERGDDDDNESAPSRAKNFAGWRVHQERVRLARQRRRELDWEGPHLHFCAENNTAEKVPGKRGDAPRRSRAHLRRWIASLAGCSTPAGRHALLETAWAGNAGQDFRNNNSRNSSDRPYGMQGRDEDDDDDNQYRRSSSQTSPNFDRFQGRNRDFGNTRNAEERPRRRAVVSQPKPWNPTSNSSSGDLLTDLEADIAAGKPLSPPSSKEMLP